MVKRGGASQSTAGGFGVVFLVQDESSKEHFALKRMLAFDKATCKAVSREVSLMVSGHPSSWLVKPSPSRNPCSLTRILFAFTLGPRPLLRPQASPLLSFYYSWSTALVETWVKY